MWHTSPMILLSVVSVCKVPIANVCCLFQITNLMHNSFILQQYVCYTTILNMFRAAPCLSSGGQIVLLWPLVSSPSDSGLNLHTVWLFTEGDDTRGCSNTICPPEDEQGAAQNVLRIIV